LGPSFGGLTFKNGEWASTNQGSITFTAITYANSNGVADGKAEMVIRADNTALQHVALNGNTSATNQLIGTSYTVPATAYAQGLAADFKLLPSAAPAAGSNLLIAGVRVSNGQSGLQLASIAQGGHNATYYADTASGSDADLAQYLTLTDSNVAMIELGVNDYETEDSATFKQNVLTMIGRYRAARPGMKVVLISAYDEARGDMLDSDGVTPLKVAYDQALYQIATEQPGVLFLNQYDAAGSYAFLNANYLGDGLHPNAAGGDYFANEQWGLVSNAAAAVAAPEPSGVVMLCTVGAGALLRRRRGKGAGSRQVGR
jgi:lysophospholipase L1-like esterase